MMIEILLKCIIFVEPASINSNLTIEFQIVNLHLKLLEIHEYKLFKDTWVINYFTRRTFHLHEPHLWPQIKKKTEDQI